MTDTDTEKRIAAEAAAELVAGGQRVGLGTGSTVAHLLPALAARRLAIRCVATSPATERAGRELGLEIESFDGLDALESLDITIDGADQVAADGWLVKGGGGAHLREKIVAAAAQRFVVIADSTKEVQALRGPVPLELRQFGMAATLAELAGLGETRLRAAPPSPDGGVIADLHCEVGDPAVLAAVLDANPGVAAHGLFGAAMVSDILTGDGRAVAHRSIQ